MAIFSSLITLCVAAAAAVNAMPTSPTSGDLSTKTSHLMARTTLAYDDIVGFVQTVPDTTEGDLYTAYQPYLEVVNGCVPFPAVDAEGDISGGLPITGADGNTDCTSSTGQVYGRAAVYGDYYAIMYAWFMPKDEPSFDLGHEYDWEGVIIWVSDSTATTADNIVAVCPSAHGEWDCSTDGYTLSGTGALIDYESIWPVDHSAGLTTTVGGMQPLIAYESLPAVALTALEDYDFGSAIVPFIDATFDSNLAKCSF